MEVIRGQLTGVSSLLAHGLPVLTELSPPYLTHFPSPRSHIAGTGPTQPDRESLDTDVASDGLLSVYFSFI